MSDLDDIIKYTKNMRLLYVEDNAEARDSSLIVFEEFFDDIIVAIDGEDGLEKFNKHQIDIIITDINMPRLSGLAMIQQLQHIDKDVHILVLSAYNESGYFIESIKLGVDGYILKPIDINSFLNTLSKIIKKVKLKHQTEQTLNLLHQYQEITDQTSIVSKTDLQGKITYANDEFCKVTGYSRDELMGQEYSFTKHPDSDLQIYSEIWHTIKDEKKAWSGILKSVAKDLKSFYAKVTIKPIFDEKGEIVEYISLMDNITDIMSPKRQLIDLIDSVDEAIVVLVRIEDFKSFEHYFGNRLGDEIQEKFSTKIFDLMPEKFKFQRIYTLGNGEFSFAKDVSKCNYPMEQFVIELELFLDYINKAKINLDHIEYAVSVVMSFAYGKSALENAQHGLRRLEKSSQNFICANNLADQEYAEAENNLKTLQMVKQALEELRIVSYFQPIINNATGKIEKYESLVRLVKSSGEVVSPHHFLDTAKSGKYYRHITSAVLENSFNALNITDFDISINFSVADIEDVSTRYKLFELLQKDSKHASRVVLELLEDEKIKDFDVIERFIVRVKSFGVKIAIDDFGTGYSNFKRLLDYQPDILKIDGSLIKNIHKDSFSFSIVKTIVIFTNEHNIKTVAEYVENEQIQAIVHDLGIDYSQGYHFGKPLPLE